MYLTTAKSHTHFGDFYCSGLVGSFRFARWMASETIKHQTLRPHHDGSGPLRVVELERPTDDKFDVCAHE